MKTKALVFFLSGGLFLVSSGAAWAEINMEEGLWEISTEMEMPGMPMVMPPVTTQQCMTKKDLVPKGQEGSGACEVSDLIQNGNSVSWKMKCRQDGGLMTSQGKITYSGSTFQGTTSTQMSGIGVEGVGDMSVKMKGRRLGPCK